MSVFRGSITNARGPVSVSDYTRLLPRLSLFRSSFYGQVAPRLTLTAIDVLPDPNLVVLLDPPAGRQALDPLRHDAPDAEPL